MRSTARSESVLISHQVGRISLVFAGRYHHLYGFVVHVPACHQHAVRREKERGAGSASRGAAHLQVDDGWRSEANRARDGVRISVELGGGVVFVGRGFGRDHRAELWATGPEFKSSKI